MTVMYCIYNICHWIKINSLLVKSLFCNYDLIFIDIYIAPLDHICATVCMYCSLHNITPMMYLYVGPNRPHLHSGIYVVMCIPPIHHIYTMVYMYISPIRPHLHNSVLVMICVPPLYTTLHNSVIAY